MTGHLPSAEARPLGLREMSWEDEGSFSQCDRDSVASADLPDTVPGTFSALWVCVSAPLSLSRMSVSKSLRPFPRRSWHRSAAHSPSSFPRLCRSPRAVLPEVWPSPVSFLNSSPSWLLLIPLSVPFPDCSRLHVPRVSLSVISCLTVSMLTIISIVTSLSLVVCSLKFLFAFALSLFVLLFLVLPSLPLLFIFSISAPSEGCFLAHLLAVSTASCVHTPCTVGVLFPSGQKHGRPQARAG